MRGFWILVLPCLGCSLSQAPPAGRQLYVGTVVGTEDVVAAVSEAGNVTVYVCGGADDFATHTHWFSGAHDEQGRLALDAGGGWSIRGTLDFETAFGEISGPDTANVTWSAARAGD